MSERPRFTLTPYIPPEADLHVAVADALRVPTRPARAVFTSWDLANAKSAVEGARKRRRGCLPGWPDLGIWWRGKLVLIELKRERCGVLSPKQRELHAKLAAADFPVVVCRSVHQVLDAVAAAGIPLRGRVLAGAA
jgi:hypothetical protein